MCGIVGAVGVKPDLVERALDAVAHRGPDARGMFVDGVVQLGHVRLSIMDVDSRSDQPFHVDGGVLSFNGEIWNYRQLRARMEARGIKFTTTGDTEVVARWLVGGGDIGDFEGMFALAWYDGDSVTLARDRFGEVPLHVAVGTGWVMWASEAKALRCVGLRASPLLEPGCTMTVTKVGGTRTSRYYDVEAVSPAHLDDDQASIALRTALEHGAEERAMSDVPVCALLSGGLDSAAICALLVQHVPNLVAYTAVMNPKSPDLRAARATAEHLGIELREVEVRPPTAEDLAEVVRVIEMPFKAQVEIGWACLRLAEVVAGDGFKVTYSGEGSDELWASYGFSYHGLKQKGWYRYRRELFHTQHRKNFPRCNKVFMSRGIECRLPFLHTELVELALSMPESAVRQGGRLKGVLERAVADVVPDVVLKRAKLAFQDGLGLKSRAAEAVADPRRFYTTEFKRMYE